MASPRLFPSAAAQASQYLLQSDACKLFVEPLYDLVAKEQQKLMLTYRDAKDACQVMLKLGIYEEHKPYESSMSSFLIHLH